MHWEPAGQVGAAAPLAAWLPARTPALPGPALLAPARRPPGDPVVLGAHVMGVDFCDRQVQLVLVSARLQRGLLGRGAANAGGRRRCSAVGGLCCAAVAVAVGHSQLDGCLCGLAAMCGVLDHRSHDGHGAQARGGQAGSAVGRVKMCGWLGAQAPMLNRQ